MGKHAASENNVGQPPKVRPRIDLLVGIGASAGGIKPLREFFAHTRPESGAAYVVVLHLSPEHASKLAEVLQTATPMPVTRVSQPVEVEPGHVYVIAPNTTLRIADDVIMPSEVLRPEDRRAPIDILFRTLAEAHRSRAVCVVLSGAGADGSTGLRRVKEHGGLTLAQDPGESEQDSMPLSAIATGLVDYVLPAAEMPGRIHAFQHARARLEGQTREATGGDGLREILDLVRTRTGHELSHHHTRAVLARIRRRQALHALPEPADYAHFVRESAQELSALVDELLVSVSEFFRDPDAFAVLERTVIPRLFRNRAAPDEVRVWIVGCATGEEAYSVAMLLKEGAESAPEPPIVRVFATDVHEEALARARAAVYTSMEVAEVSPERLRRFFVKEGPDYRVRRDLREAVLCTPHNVLSDSPFARLDLIVCRNLLTYLGRAAQDKVMDTIHFALRPGGYLFLGAAETPGEYGSSLFHAVDESARIFVRRTADARIEAGVRADAGLGSRAAKPAATMERPRLPSPSPATLHLQLLEEYAPPSLVVNDEYQVVHLSGGAGRYLQVPGGDVTRDVFNLARPELRLELRAALARAAHDRAPVRVVGMRVSVDGAQREVDLTVRPVINEGDAARGFFVILFEERAAAGAAADGQGGAIQVADPSDAGIARQLDDELTRAHASLRLTVEQYETQVEEEKAANEELQALNEELRSAAEELETSKEELQSVNEELTTVNQELKERVDDLAVANSQFQNLMTATDVAAIFLDRSLRVTLSTPRARDVFNLLPLDVGRPLADITSRVPDVPLHQDIEQVLDRLREIERQVRTDDGRWYRMRTLPYHTSEQQVAGVVITLQDITDRRRAEAVAEQSTARLRLVYDEAVEYAIMSITLGGDVDSWSTGAERMFGHSPEQILGQPVAILFTPEDRLSGEPQKELRQALEMGRAMAERWYVRRDGTRVFCGSSTAAAAGGAGFVKIARDWTPQEGRG